MRTRLPALRRLVPWILGLAGLGAVLFDGRRAPAADLPVAAEPRVDRDDPWLDPFGVFYVGRHPETFEGVAHRVFARQLDWERPGAPRVLDAAVLEGNLDGLIVTLQLQTEALQRRGVESVGYHRYCVPEGDDRSQALRFVREAVERYDGDDDLGCQGPTGPDCYVPGDGAFPLDPAGLRTRAIHRWQVENEFFYFTLDCAEHRKGEPIGAEKAVDYLEAVAGAIRTADTRATVIAPAVCGIEPLLLEGGFTDALDRGGTDCDRTLLTRAEVEAHPRAWEKQRAAVARDRARHEQVLTRTADVFDAVDFHTYANDYRLSTAFVKWMEALGLSGKAVISTEMSGPYYMFPEMGVPHPTRCAKEGRDDRGSTRYSDAVLSEYVVKTLVVGLASGVRRMHWATGEELFEPYLDNYQRLGLVEKDGRRKPAWHTWRLLMETLRGFTGVEKVDGDVYAFRFPDRPPVVVAWEEGGRRTVDLGAVFGDAPVSRTRVITALGPGGEPVQPVAETRPATTVEIEDLPVFVVVGGD